MAYVVGMILALGAGILGTAAAMERDRAYYAVILIVIATYYDLFAVIGGDMQALGVEVAMTAGFVALAVVGFKTSQWVIVAGLLGHTTLDLFHGHVVDNSGMPVWWPAFCGTYDAVAAFYLAWRLLAARLCNETFEHLALVSRGRPKVITRAVDRQEHLVELPAPAAW